MSFANRIKQLRHERRYSQSEFADLLGVKRATLGKWETGVNKPTADLLITIAQQFRVSTDWLLGHSEYKTLGEYFNSKYDTKQLAKEVRELELLDVFGRLNETGQKEALSRAKELTELRKYTL